MTAERWVRRARLPKVRAAVRDDDYGAIYPYLLSHFRRINRPLEDSDLIVALHIAYGWMPTIAKPRHSIPMMKEHRSELLKITEAAIDARVPEISEKELRLLKRFANNSTVGASKLLHFFNPAVYPIWDGHVAGRFMWNGVTRATYEKEFRLLEYFQELWNWKSSEAVQTEMAELRRIAGYLKCVADVRVLELVLFHPTP